jgi:hypothetical protein
VRDGRHVFDGSVRSSSSEDAFNSELLLHTLWLLGLKSVLLLVNFDIDDEWLHELVFSESVYPSIDGWQRVLDVEGIEEVFLRLCEFLNDDSLQE